MAEPITLAPLFDALRDLITWFNNTDVKGIIIGGVAASLLGRPRMTRDVDALVLLEEVEWADFLQKSPKYNFEPRISDPLIFAQNSRMLLLRHKPSSIDVDIAFAGLYFEENSIANATFIDIEGILLPLPKPEDLIVMKAIAARPKDLIDIESLIDANPAIDRENIFSIVKEFAEALSMSELTENLNKIFRKKSVK